MQRADEMKVSIFLICMHPNLKIVNYPFKTYKYGELYGFTHMKNPIKGGLYDPAMGPMDIKEK